ncbi:MAG: serine hydrolase domain-containing protein [Bacteroidota bacterium]
MKKLMFALIVSFTYLSIPINAQNQLKPEEGIAGLVKDGIVAGIVGGYSIDGEVKLIINDGFSDMDQQIPFTGNTITRIASIAKPMTAVAIMQLYEKGLLKLDDPIRKYLKDYPVSQQGEITIRHLLTHTSGVKAYQSTKEMKSKKTYESLSDASAVFENRKLSFVPGTAYQYTTYGYVLLGRVIESVSGLSYNEYMEKNIWTKAAMSDTGVEIFDQTYEGKSALYKHHKGKIQLRDQNNLSNRTPGGGIQSTFYDLIKFGNALLNNELLKRSTFEMMLEDPKIRKEGNGYGFGWFLYGVNPECGNVIGHSGHQNGASTQLMILPEINTVIVVLANTSGTWQQVVNTSVSFFKSAYQQSNQSVEKTEE